MNVTAAREAVVMKGRFAKAPVALTSRRAGDSVGWLVLWEEGSSSALTLTLPRVVRGGRMPSR